jgi:hypothetical protein
VRPFASLEGSASSLDYRQIRASHEPFGSPLCQHWQKAEGSLRGALPLKSFHLAKARKPGQRSLDGDLKRQTAKHFLWQPEILFGQGFFIRLRKSICLTAKCQADNLDPLVNRVERNLTT